MAALSLSRWDIHLAIKIVRLVNQVYDEQGIRLELNHDSTLKILQENEWDVAKAADAILHRDQQYFWSVETNWGKFILILGTKVYIL